MENIISLNEFREENGILIGDFENRKAVNRHAMLAWVHHEQQRKLLNKHPIKGINGFSPEEKNKYKQHQDAFNHHTEMIKKLPNRTTVRSTNPLNNLIDKLAKNKYAYPENE